MSKKAKKFVTLHSVSYDDPDFGRVLEKPNVVITLTDANTIRDLKAAKAIREVKSNENGLVEGAEVEGELDAARKKAAQQQDDDEGDGLGGDDADADGDDDDDDQGDEVDVGTLTVAQLKEGLDAAGVEYAPNAKKAALIDLYTANVK